MVPSVASAGHNFGHLQTAAGIGQFHVAEPHLAVVSNKDRHFPGWVLNRETCLERRSHVLKHGPEREPHNKPHPKAGLSSARPLPIPPLAFTDVLDKES